MQDETRNETFANELSNGRPRFVATAVFRPKQQYHDEAGRENGAKVPQDLGLRAVTRDGPCLHANGQVPNMFSGASSSEVEPDTRAGGSIRDRIAALSAAAGVTRLNVTSGVAFDVGFQSASKPRPPPRVVSRFITNNVKRNDESVVSKSQDVSSSEIGAVKDKSIAFEVSFEDEPCSKRAKDEPVLLQSPFKAFKTRSNLRRQQKTKPSSPQAAQTISPWKSGARGFQASSPKGDSNLSSDILVKDDKSLDQSDVEKTAQKQCELSFVQGKRLTEKASSGVVTYDSTSDDEIPVKSKQEDCEDQTYSEGPKLLKRNTFTLDTVSNQGLPIVAVLNELASKEETKQETVLPSSEFVQKRSTFTLDSSSQSIESESREGVPVASVLNDFATKQEFEQKLQSDVDASSLLNDNSQKRSTFTLESVSREIDDAIAEAGILDNALLEGAKIEDEESFQIETVNVDTLANEDLSLEKKHKSSENLFLEKKPESTEKRSTYTLDTVSSSLQSGAEEGVPVSEVLSQLATREELKSSTLSDAEDSLTQTECSPKRSTFTLDTVSQSLDDAQSKGLPAVDVLDQLASKHESYLPVSTPLEHNSNSRPTQNRGTYTLDTVSHAIEEAVEKGVPVSVTLNHLAQEGKPAHNYDDSSAGKVVHGLKSQSEARPSSPDDRDEIEASFEDALEQLEDCLNFVSFPSASDHKRRSAYRKRMSLHQEQSSPNREQSSSNRKQSSSDRERSSFDRDSLSSDRERSFSDRDSLSPDRDSSSLDREQSSFDRTRTSSEAPEKRGTYNLDDVANSVEHGLKDGVPVVETLDDLSKTKTLPKDGIEKSSLPEQRRGTYTLDEVSRSLQTASIQGIPVVEALKNLTIEHDPARGTGESAQKRGTYKLDDVSKSLEHAKNTGIPVVEALESLSKEKPASPLRLKIPERSPENRGTYTLDEVSNTLEKAKLKGLPVVDALGQITTAKDVSIRQTPDAVHRRQEKLVNRKTYALASPLETIGEGTKLRLYDGSQRQMLSPLSLHMKAKDMTPSKTNSESKARGLGVVQKLDFLTSACELLLQANAKEIAKDDQQTESIPESTRDTPTTDESLRRSHEMHSEDVEVESCTDGKQTERCTYSLDSVSKSIDDAKAAGIPIVDALKNVTSVSKACSTNRSNLKRLNSKSDSELINEGNQKPYSNRQTHSLEDMSMTLEEAKKKGIPVIQALDQLANELAEFSKNTLGEEVEIKPLGKDYRKRKRHSDTPMRRPSQEESPDPSPMRKAFSLDDVAFAVQKAFQSGTSLNDLLDSLASEKPADPVLSSRDIRPRSVDSGFISSLSDYDISSYSFDSSRNRSNTYIFDSSSEELDLAKNVSPQVKEKIVHEANTTGSPVQGENRRTFTLDHVSGSVARELSRDIPVIEALEKLALTSSEVKTDKAKETECKENAKNVTTEIGDNVKSSNSGRKKSPPKPKRKISNNKNAQQPNSDPFVIEFFSSNGSEQFNTSKFEIVNNKVQEVNFTNNDANATKPEKDIKSAGNKVELDKTSPLAPTGEHKSVELRNDSSSASPRGRATWRPSGSVLDKIASLMDAAEDCGISPSDVLNQVTDLPYDAEGEIVETPDDVTEQKKETSQIAYLRMQLEEKRRHIEAEKYRAQAEWEDQRRRLGQTAFWYVIGKAQGGQNVGEGTGAEVAQPEKPHFQDRPRKPVAEFPNQPSPPIAWSSPANSPAPVFKPANDPQFETREFRLSDYPPAEDLGTNQDTVRPSSQPAVEFGSRSRPIAVPPRPSSHDPAASHYTAPPRKCWDVEAAQVPTPPPLVHPDTTPVRTDAKKENPQRKPFEREIEVETNPAKKGMAMFIGDDASPVSQGLTPEQERKREKFLRLREKKQEEDRLRKEAELEKKRRREEKQREKEMQQRMEEERLHREELERQNAEQELRMREAQAARVPDSYTTYRRPGPRHQASDVNEDTNNYYAPTPTQPSGFAEFSGPQCYVKPSGKSNRKIIVNAISHVCLSGTVNQDQKEKCLQAISESDGHHFMILFKDGLKFRGMYVHNLENDQLFKVFGIGPRVITSKMIEGFYKYNSGGKEFTKIPGKTLSIAVDGLAIQKSYWQSGKPSVQSKTSSNLKRPPRPPQR